MGKKSEYGTAEGSLPRNRADAGSGRAGQRKNNSIALSHFQIIGKRIGEAAGNPCADLFQSGGGRNEKSI